MKKYLIIILSAVSMMYSCSDDFESSTIEAGDLPINIDAEYPVKGVGTRATDNGFVVDDAVGLFVVDYNRDGTPGDLVMKGNRADNVKFTFTGGRWEANYQLYWASKNTPADFYGYYPFNENMQSVTEYAFSVYKNQDGTTNNKSNYEQSDLLWAKAEKVQPTTDAVQLQYRHLMAGITIQLQMGTGFDASEWAQLDKTVLIDNVQTNATVNLQTGAITLSPSGESEGGLTPLIYNNMWRAVVVPQTVAAGKRVISVTVDGRNYELKKPEAVQYVSGKMHNFTITVNKNTATGDYSFDLTADDIVAWIDDADLHDGLVRQYVIVDVNEPGTLSKVMAYRGIEADKVTGLKLQGNLNGDDLGWLREHCTHLSDLNMSKVILQDGVLSNMGIPTMRHYVFPEKSLKVIARECFLNATGLHFSNLSLPEGLETIEVGIPNGNFVGYIPKYIGELHLPSTMKYLWGGFEASQFTGELHLPEGIIEAVGPSGDFTGSLHFPSSLQKVSGQWGYKNMTGTVVIPRCMTKVDGFWDGAGFSHVEFHDGVTEICGNAFRNGNLSGELVLPPNCRKVSIDAFPGNKFSRIIFNDELRIIGENAFNNNPYLVGTLTLPKNVACIPGGCFADCPGITGLIIPANVVIIEGGAFRGCNGIASIVCEGEEPPLVVGDAFYGVNKDNFTVEVPKGCVEKYRNAEGWKEFKRIAEYSNFACRPAQANALNNAHDEALVLNADGAWTVKHKPDWVRLSKTSGNGKSEIQLTFLDMPHGNGMRRDSILFEMATSQSSTTGSSTVETYCVVSQYDYEHEEDSYLTLQQHTKGNGLDLVFMGDGWTGADISSGEYLDMVRQQTEYFFGIEPYKSHREYFNVYVTFPLSQEKGVNTMHTYVNNRFGTLYGHTDEATIDHLLTETDEVYKYAVDKTPMTEGDRWKGQLILIPNSDEYEGVTFFNGECALSLCPPSSRPYPQDTRGTVQHEACGHGFGKLGDENIKYQAWIDPITSGQIDGYHNRGWYRNLATTSKMNQVWWADMIFDPRYSDQVDVFEGGYGYMRGVFRPENNSCMNYGIPYFNAPSRKDIMWRILDYSGVGYSDDYFYSHDTNKWGDTDGQTRAGAAHASLTGNAITSSNNHCAPMIVDAKTMGNKVREIINRNKNKE